MSPIYDLQPLSLQATGNSDIKYSILDVAVDFLCER